MGIKRLRKFIYLLQLEEYQTSRYNLWLKKHSIDRLEERKNKLRWTTRARLTLALSLLLNIFSPEEKSVENANRFLGPFFKMAQKLIILIAKLKLRFFSPITRVVVVGSYGKTTFKEMLAWVLATNSSVFKTPGNINTAIGIAQVILKNLKKHHQLMIIEADAYQAGEIKEICQLIAPNFGVITVIGWMHLERFGSVDNIRSTKFEMAEFIKDKNRFFYPPKDHQFINFEKTVEKIAGKLFVPTSTIKERIASFTPPDHRLTVKKVSQKMILLDDSYNSNPLGFQKALDKLKSYPHHQRIVVTPGMIELGSQQFSLNETAGFETAKIADIFVIVGKTNQRALLSGAKKAKRKKLRIIFIDKNDRFADKINAFLRPPAAILLENDLPDHYF